MAHAEMIYAPAIGQLTLMVEYLALLTAQVLPTLLHKVSNTFKLVTQQTMVVVFDHQFKDR